MTEIYISRNQIDKDTVRPIYVLRPEDWSTFSTSLTEMQKTFAQARGFKAESGQRVQLPDSSGNIEFVLFGVGSEQMDIMGPIRAGILSRSLPEGLYEFHNLPNGWSEELAAIGWGLGAYKFERYLSDEKNFPTLVTDIENIEELTSLVSSVHMGRDLINTPTNDMGPEVLGRKALELAREFKAEAKAIIGEDLIEQNFPMIHAVGRAAHEPPRLIEILWGNPENPTLALIGKGITFDTGGVNMKSAAGARIMKKDMGGAAHVMALSRMIMENKLPIHLHVLLSIAENSVSAGAYRPGDILTSRSGQTVEIDNTDAEGRLVMADALTYAAEKGPALIIDFATLTGAARVALGPSLPPFFSNRKTYVGDIVDTSLDIFDPVWHMPLWQPYFNYLKSPIADMKNAGGSFGGSITAALFLEKFVKNTPWMHFDVYGWNPSATAGHPAGGEMFAIRALYAWLKAGGLEGDFSS